MSSMLTLPPTKEQIIARQVCQKITKLRNNNEIDGEKAAKLAISLVLARLRETEEKKLVDTIEAELKICQKSILA